MVGRTGGIPTVTGSSTSASAGAAEPEAPLDESPPVPGRTSPAAEVAAAPLTTASPPTDSPDSVTTFSGYSGAAEAPPGRTQPNRRSWAVWLRSTRARVLAVYLLLLVISGLLIVFTIRQVLTIRLDGRVDEALRQEILEVTQLVENGRDPLTAVPFTTLDRAFDVYMDRNVPNVEEAFLTFIGGDLHRDRMRSFPGRVIPPETLAAFAEFVVDGDDRQEMEGSFQTDHGDARYRAVRLTTGPEVGAFVVTILPVGGRREIRELETYGALVTLGVVLLAGVSAWFLSGRVLAPVRNLTRTARSISQDDRSGRLPVSGTSETVEMAETFNAMLDRLEGVYQSQLEFLRGAGHELRTPLTVAMGHLELVGDDEQQRQATIAIVTDELSRMGRIVDDLQSLAESTHPDFVIRRELDLEPLAHDILLKASALGDHRWRLDEVAEGTIVADRDRLVEAALNLADNAVKNSAVGDTIGIGVGVRGDEVHIWVRDTGVGISAAEQQRIFERFMRGDAAGRRYRGAGLGLAVVATIAVAHGGRVDLDSVPGVGSTFTIVIPRGAS